MTDHLSTYGYAFQAKIITALLTDKSFVQQIRDILYAKYFENEANRWLVASIFTYFDEYHSTPTLVVIRSLLDDVEDDVLKQDIVTRLQDIHKYIGSDDLPYIKDRTINFCRNQEIKRAILDSAQLLKAGHYDEIVANINNAAKAGTSNDIGHEYNVNIDERYEEAVREPRPTGWSIINDLMDGGLGRGELGVFVAPSGIGKSWALQHIGATALKAGYNVLHYTMELNSSYTGLRYDALLTGIPVQNLKYHKDDVKAVIEKTPGKLIVKYWPTKTASVNTIRSHIDKCVLRDIKPDIIIIDYADLLKSVKVNEKRHAELEMLYEDIRGLAGELEVPVWTASQTNRTGLEEDFIGAEKIAESYGKIMVSDFVISLARRPHDKVAGTANWHVIKNRFGPDGITLPSKMNTSNGHIEIFSEQTSIGKSTKIERQSGGAAERQLLSQKFKEINGDAFG